MPAPANTITTTDVDRALDIEMLTRFNHDTTRLLELLGIFGTETVAAGTALYQYKVTGELNTDERAEGEIVPLSNFKAKKGDPITVNVDFYRKSTTAEAILKSGYENACVKTDDKMLTKVRGKIMSDFFTYLANGTSTATGKNLQAALAKADATLADKLESNDDAAETLIHFVNRFDIADYLAEANVSTQTAYGMTYIQSFLGVDNIFVTSKVPQGTVYVTPSENIHIYGVDFGALDSAGLTYSTLDGSLIGTAHTAEHDCASAMTHVAVGAKMLAEVLDYIVKATIGGTSSQSDDILIEEKPAFDPTSDTPPTTKNKTDEINAWAEAHDISLAGCSNKEQMIEAITAALAEAE
ncbi:MAG: hypothetical protein HFJ65_03385 [Eggerthellaceae bacterium]|nr:hypothetical protein [Eggerthellaceae bacterium]